MVNPQILERGICRAHLEEVLYERHQEVNEIWAERPPWKWTHKGARKKWVEKGVDARGEGQRYVWEERG